MAISEDNGKNISHCEPIRALIESTVEFWMTVNVKVVFISRMSDIIFECSQRWTPRIYLLKLDQYIIYIESLIIDRDCNTSHPRCPHFSSERVHGSGRKCQPVRLVTWWCSCYMSITYQIWHLQLTVFHEIVCWVGNPIKSQYKQYSVVQ